MKHAAAWLLLLMLGIILIVAGWRGRLGSVVGALITPSQLTDISNDTSTSSGSGGTDGNGNPIPVNGTCPKGYLYYNNACYPLVAS